MSELLAPNISRGLQTKIEVIKQVEPLVQEAVDSILVDAETCWQPSDFLPTMNTEDALDQIRLLRTRSAGLPNEVMLSLVGNMITEEALPSYQTYFNLVNGINEERNLTSKNPWVSWSRGWTAEENRHGDLLNKYLYLTGRVDMKQVEIVIQRLITNGFDPKTEACPYGTMIYTSFQERATKISHLNTGKLADKAGDSVLSRICKTIAGDEARHEKAYKSFMSRIFEIDPNGAMLSFETMMRTQIVMPAVGINSDKEPDLFERFSAITQKIGIYTMFDYAKIIEHLVELWNIESITGLEGQAAKAQEYLCKLSSRYARVAERMRAPENITLNWLSC